MSGRVESGQDGGMTGEPIALALDDDERQFLRAAMLNWGGPAEPTHEFAVALGFHNAESLSRDVWNLWKTLETEGALPAADWRRVLLAAEVVFASDVVGVGLDWSIVSGFPDDESIRILRRLQRKLPRWRGSFQFTTDEDGHVHLSDLERPSS